MPYYCVVRKKGSKAVYLVGQHSACPGGKVVKANSFDAALKKTNPKRRRRRAGRRRRR